MFIPIRLSTIMIVGCFWYILGLHKSIWAFDNPFGFVSVLFSPIQQVLKPLNTYQNKNLVKTATEPVVGVFRSLGSVRFYLCAARG